MPHLERHLYHSKCLEIILRRLENETLSVEEVNEIKDSVDEYIEFYRVCFFIFILFCFILFYFVLFCFILFYFVLFCFILFYICDWVVEGIDIYHLLFGVYLLTPSLGPRFL